jgi:hypothetical protein
MRHISKKLPQFCRIIQRRATRDLYFAQFQETVRSINTSNIVVLIEKFGPPKAMACDIRDGCHDTLAFKATNSLLFGTQIAGRLRWGVKYWVCSG